MADDPVQMVPLTEVQALIAAAVLPVQTALDEAKRTIRTLLRQIYGTRSERAEIVLDAEGQQFINPAWHVGTPAPSPVSENPAEAEAPVRAKRQVHGVAQRHPHLPIKETQAALAPELQEQVEEGSLKIERTGRFHDSLVVPRGSPFIQREFEVQLVKAADSQPVLVAPMTPQLVEGGSLADETIHSLVIAKFMDAIPLHRTLCAWERQQIDVSKQTVNDALTAWSATFQSLAETIITLVLTAEVVFADESWARVQKPGSCASTNIWTLVGNGLVGYQFTPDRTHKRAAEIIPPDFRGYLMCDAWAGWKTLADIRRAGCNAHARRPFAAFAKENDDAAKMVRLYADLYRFEHLATEGPPQTLLERRMTIRTRDSTPIMDQIEVEAARIAKSYPNSHPLAEGARYIANHREALRRFLREPLLPPDNNAAENALRINALIRKNSMFFGSNEGGERAAIALTVLHSCRLTGTEPLAYLQRVTPALIQHRRGKSIDLAALIPVPQAKPS